jgi:hypothetical protein
MTERFITHFENNEANVSQGAASCFEEISPFFKQTLVREGMKSICEKFSSEGSVGPVWAAKFMEPDNSAAARVKQTEVFQRVIPFVEKIQHSLFKR